jgi:hypothetical protein
MMKRDSAGWSNRILDSAVAGSVICKKISTGFKVYSNNVY